MQCPHSPSLPCVGGDDLARVGQKCLLVVALRFTPHSLVKHLLSFFPEPVPCWVPGYREGQASAPRPPGGRANIVWSHSLSAFHLASGTQIPASSGA